MQLDVDNADWLHKQWYGGMWDFTGKTNTALGKNPRKKS